ncbi:uncharacterized protein LOC124155672 [Ischnura elegans]|uniref:uncharacterized protein LOC124155672 n=1 Tax=Ischnura elegans TaxID=197161 RepID=UPI001ED899A6|nr:uncharacterized protein LOC124155672 [Ischnura elegans]
MVGAFGGPVLRGPHSVGPFIVGAGRRGRIATERSSSSVSSPTPQAPSEQQDAILLSSSAKVPEDGGGGGGGGGCGFPGTITFWKERQRGGIQPRGRGSLRRRGKDEELIHYNRTGAGLSCRLWQHWQRQQQHRHVPKEHEMHLDLVQPQEGKESTVLQLSPVESPQPSSSPLPSCFRQASPEEAAEDLEARGEPRYKYEGWGMGVGADGGRQQQLRIIAASLRIVYREENESFGVNLGGGRRGSSCVWGEETLLLRKRDDEESTAPLCAISAEAVSREFVHLAPLVRSTLECVSVVPPHTLPLLAPPQHHHDPFVFFDNPKDNANRLASAFLLSAVGFFLMLITTFYIAYFL